MRQGSPLARLPAETITAKRASIRNGVLRASPHIKTNAVQAIAGPDLRILFRSYDDLFFADRLQALIESSGSHIYFEVSNRMTSAGASIRAQVHKGATHIYRVAVSGPVLFSSFTKPGERLEVNGVVCEDRLQSLLILVEHELVHLYEMLTTGDSRHGPFFRDIALNTFGHTDYRHGLVTPMQRVAEVLDMRVGDPVSFRFEGQQLVGRVRRITKRATVLVPVEGAAGEVVLKFLVPLGALERVPAG